MKTWLIGFFFLVFAVSTVAAHPHVWVKARAELVFNESDHLTGVRHVWRFDEGFSAYATQGLDANGDGVLSREELQELAQVNIDSLRQFEYFTYVQIGEEDPKYRHPEEFWLEHDGELLTLFYTLPMATAVAPDPEKGFDELTVEVFDPTFFVDMTFVVDEPAAITGGTGACTTSLERRKELDIFQSQLLAEIPATEQVPDNLLPVVGELSNTIFVQCVSS